MRTGPLERRPLSSIQKRLSDVLKQAIQRDPELQRLGFRLHDLVKVPGANVVRYSIVAHYHWCERCLFAQISSLMKFDEAAAQRLRNLKLRNWQKKISKICTDAGEPELLVENTEDLNGPPDCFEYIVDYDTSSPCCASIKKTPQMFCECLNDCSIGAC